MARILLPPQLLSLRGRVGDLVFRRIRGRTFVSARPRPSQAPPTPAQAATRARFRAASLYAAHVLEDPDQRRRYELAARDGFPSARAAAMADFFHPPVVRAIELHGYRGRRGDLIVVLASDDGGVASVYVTVRFPQGQVLEEGHATRTDGWWTYRARADVPAARAVTIEVTAADLPGNRTTSNAAWTR